MLEIINPIQNEPTVYTLEAENILGRAIGKANVIIQSHEPEFKKEYTKAPKILTPLQAKIVPSDSTLIYEVKFEGVPEPDIKWLKNGKELLPDENVSIVNKSYSSILKVTKMDRKRVGKYEIIVNNKGGEAKSSGSVVVSDKAENKELKAPRFIVPLIPKMVSENEVIILEAKVESIPSSSFQWFVQALPVKTASDLRIVTHDNKSILIIESFKKQNVGSYTCRAENVAGSVTSTATINLLEKQDQEETTEYISPRFTEKIKTARVMDGEKLILTAIVSGQPLPKVEWIHDDQPIREAKDVVISQDNSGLCTLTISEVFPEDAGQYICRAINHVGEAICSATVTVEGIFIYVYVKKNTNHLI